MTDRPERVLRARPSLTSVPVSPQAARRYHAANAAKGEFVRERIARLVDKGSVAWRTATANVSAG